MKASGLGCLYGVVGRIWASQWSFRRLMGVKKHRESQGMGQTQWVALDSRVYNFLPAPLHLSLYSLLVETHGIWGRLMGMCVNRVGFSGNGWLMVSTDPVGWRAYFHAWQLRGKAFWYRETAYGQGHSQLYSRKWVNVTARMLWEVQGKLVTIRLNTPLLVIN